MAAPTKEERLRAVHEEAMVLFDEIQSAMRDERQLNLEDRRFYSIAGAQWEGPLGQQFENKPKFEVNKIHLAVIRIINEYRNNRITVNFVSKDGAPSDDLADVCDGLYRADEQDSSAEEAYDNAFEEAVGGGFGAWRLRNVYEDDEDEDNDRQRIIMEPIYDADSSVFFDLNAKKQDKSDAKHCFVLTSMTRGAYEVEYDDDPATWPKEVHYNEFDWLTPDVVYIAEYYRVEMKRSSVYVFEMIDGTEVFVKQEDIEEKRKEIEAKGGREVRTKKIEKRKVHKYILNGARVMEDCGYIAGRHIPIIPVYGKRWFVDNVERCMGHVRLPKDAQRLKNMQVSKLGEISALGSVSKPIFTAEQMAGHKQMWEEDNIKNYPYLLINAIMDATGQEAAAGPVGYTKPAEVPQALAALLQITEQDIQDLLGNQQDGEKIEGNISTDTAMLIQNRLDMQTFIYMSNMAKAMRRCGEIWLSMAQDVFVEEGRKMKVVGEQGDSEQVELLRKVMEDDGVTMKLENDLSKAKFDVAVEVGPASSTKRAATVRALTNMAGVTDDPETKQVLSAMIMMNMEGEGVSDARAFFRRRLIKMGVLEPTEQEAMELAEEAANTPPDPQQQYLRSAAAAEEARGQKALAETLETQADTDKKRAETIEILNKINLDELKALVEVVEKLGPRVEPSGADIQA